MEPKHLASIIEMPVGGADTASPPPPVPLTGASFARDQINDPNSRIDWPLCSNPGLYGRGLQPRSPSVSRDRLLAPDFESSSS